MTQKTTVTQRGDQLTIMAGNALTPSVLSLDIDKARKGQFGLSDNKQGESVLEFKPEGRKTADVIAIYAHQKDARKALASIFKSMGGNADGNKSIVSLILYILKIMGLTLLIIFIIGLLLFFGVQQFLLGDVNDSAAPVAFESAPSSAQQIDRQSLPVGVPFPVDTYVQTLEN